MARVILDAASCCVSAFLAPREGRAPSRPPPLRVHPGRNTLRSTRPHPLRLRTRCTRAAPGAGRPNGGVPVHTTPIRHGSTPDARRMETSICFAMLVAGQDEAYDLIHTSTLFRANEPLSANETPPTPFVNRR